MNIPGLTNLIDLFFTISRVAGIGVALFGIIAFGTSMSSHDSTQRVNGLMAIFGGVVICFAKEILVALGVTI
jgi:hypothetical protein